jgi:hypothetical protein
VLGPTQGAALALGKQMMPGEELGLVPGRAARISAGGDGLRRRAVLQHWEATGRTRTYSGQH